MNHFRKFFLVMLLFSSVYGFSQGFFFGISAGGSYVDVDKKDQLSSVALISSPDTTGWNVDAEIGYDINSKMFATAQIGYQKFNDVKLFNYLLTLNKRFKKVYLGAVVGISSIELTKEHINAALTDKRDDAFAYGFQIGYEKPINNNVSIFTQYRFLKAEHKTILKTLTAQSELIRDNFSLLSVGIRWR